MRHTLNNDGVLELGGISAVKLTAKYGTPLYVMEEDKIRVSMKSFKDALTRSYGGNGLVCFASKAFCCKEIYRIAQSEGLGIDVVSAGELQTALSVGFDTSKICMHGNNKTPAELKLAIDSNVGRIVVDNLEELKTLAAYCGELNKEVKIMLRIKPGVEAHTHDFIATGRIDSKFGFALETGEALAAAKIALKTKNIRLAGVHCHIGSQILCTEPFMLAAKVMTEFIAEIKNETGVLLPELNLGGGYGIVYTEKDEPVPVEEMIKKITDTVHETARANKIDIPFLILEPGRAITGESGTTLYTVGSVKTIPGVRTYVAVDGGIFENPRYALYKAEYEMLIAGKAKEPKNTIVTVAGKCCESGDLLGENVPLQKAEAGDILAVLSTGAYNFSMASNYNRNPRPPVVMVKDGKDRLIVKSDSPADLCKNDI